MTFWITQSTDGESMMSSSSSSKDCMASSPGDRIASLETLVGFLERIKAQEDQMQDMATCVMSIDSTLAGIKTNMEDQLRQMEIRLSEVESQVTERALENRLVHIQEDLAQLKQVSLLASQKQLQDMKQHSGMSRHDHVETSETHHIVDGDELSANLERGVSSDEKCEGTLPQSSGESQQPVVFDCSRDLHAWCVVHATRHLSNPRWVVSFVIPIIFMSFSMAFVILQLFLLAGCILESSFQRCSLHDHCNLGEWCSPALAGTFPTAPGVCFDCWSAEMFYKARFLSAPYEVYPDPYELMADAAGDMWLHDGSLHCNATDTMARRCDFLVHNLENVTPLSMLICVAMAGLIVASVVDELDETEDCELLSFQIVIIQSKPTQKYIVMAMSWLTCSLRRWVLPMMTVGACLALVLRNPLSGSNLLLNGLSICFVTSLDDSLITLMYFPFRAAEDLPTYAISFRNWIFNRVYALFMFAALLGTLLQTEHLLANHGNEAKYGAVCSDIREIVLVPCFYICFSFAFLHALLRWYLRFRAKEVKVPEKLSSHMPSLESGFRIDMVLDLAQLISELLIPPFLVWYFRAAFVAQGPLVLLQIGDAVNLLSSPA